MRHKGRKNRCYKALNERILHQELDFSWPVSDPSFDLKQTSSVFQEQNLIQYVLGLLANSLLSLFHAKYVHVDIRLFITQTSYHLGLNQFMMKQAFNTPQG